MALANLLNRTVTITTRTGSGSTDDYGNESDTETTVETVGELQQRQRSEDDTELSDTSWLLVLPAGTAISSDSIVTVDNVDYEVAGEPWPVRNPRTGTNSHIEATLRRVAGADTP